MDRRQLSQLFERYLRDECSSEEIDILLQFFGHEEDNPILEELIKKTLRDYVDDGFGQQEEVIRAFNQTDIYLANMLAEEKGRYTGFRIRSYFRYAVAASVILASFIGIGFYLINYSSAPVNDRAVTENDADPGTDKAVLTLSDGRKVPLNNTEQHVLLDDSGVRISGTIKGQLIYEIADNLSPDESPAKYNQVNTPRGGQYRISLPDGTHVWLNAASLLRYPVRFNSKERIVELEGEAFFEVAAQQSTGTSRKGEKGKRIPFIVRTASQEIEVLGTQFNVSAHPDEQHSKTTLVEGSVLVRGSQFEKSESLKNRYVILKPGDQAVYSDGNIQASPVDVESVIAWKSGEFIFNDMLLSDIMKHLSRWYDVEVEYARLPPTRYTVFMSRQVPLSRMLNTLEKTGNLRFTLDENNVIKVNH